VKTLPDDIHVLSGSYVLDALTGPEREDFERHLNHCPSCEEEVRGLRETAARLAMAKAVPPPAGMEERVLGATYRTRQLPPLVTDLADRRERRMRERRVPRRLFLAAAAAGVAALAVFGIAQHQLDTGRPGSSAIGTVTGAADARSETMETSLGGTVTLVVSARQAEAVVTTTGLPSLSPARVYQLWIMGPSGARSVGLLSGTGETEPVLATGLAPGDRIGITVEPAGGSPSPTTAPVVVMPVSA
jgi:anti-sigma-K factor RskA